MDNERTKLIKLGSFVAVGIIFFIFILYLIGRQQNLFEQTFRVQTVFENVDGLQKGNSVWFVGVKVGTVKQVDIESAKAVRLTLNLISDSRKFIKKDVVASISSDGVIGNKIVILSGGTDAAEPVERMDIIKSETSTGIGDLLTTFETTNDNLKAITTDFKKITSGIVSGKGTVGGLFQDSLMYGQIQASIRQARLASNNTERATRELSTMMANINAGKGMAGALLNSPDYEKRLDASVTSVQKTIENASGTVERLNLMTDELKNLVKDINDPSSPLGVMMSDTVFAKNLQETMQNLEGSTGQLDETLKDAKKSFILRENIFRKNKEYRKKNLKKEAGSGDSPRGN
ncbi:MAG: MlaD family protein [Bacteroidota bacterium]